MCGDHIYVCIEYDLCFPFYGLHRIDLSCIQRPDSTFARQKAQPLARLFPVLLVDSINIHTYTTKSFARHAKKEKKEKERDRNANDTRHPVRMPCDTDALLFFSPLIMIQNLPLPLPHHSTRPQDWCSQGRHHSPSVPRIHGAEQTGQTARSRVHSIARAWYSPRRLGLARPSLSMSD